MWGVNGSLNRRQGSMKAGTGAGVSLGKLRQRRWVGLRTMLSRDTGFAGGLARGAGNSCVPTLWRNDEGAEMQHV